MEKIKIEKSGLKKFVEFALTNFVIIAFIILLKLPILQTS